MILKKRDVVEVKVSKTFYVGNLEWHTTPEELKEFFSVIGTVHSVDIIKDRETGKSKGFGFVTMDNADDAMKEMNGKDFRGRSLKISEARERMARPSFREVTPPRVTGGELDRIY
jgi:RNA recognition motif-containing protein